MGFPDLSSLTAALTATLLGSSSSSSSTSTAALDALAVCASLQSQYPDKLAYNDLTANLTLNADYLEATTRYWSAANADLNNLPACVFLPTTAQEVAGAVQALNAHPLAHWAVKGGGHNPNVGWSSSAGGVLIAMETLNASTLDADDLAHVGAGARWGAAQQALDPYGRAIAAGRLGDVGVGGFVLGGGLSFLSGELGFTADTVVEMEIVTAAGEVTRANTEQNSDIFYALKGGGNQFAIVTEYVLQTIPIGKVWGGYKIFTLDKKDAVLAATHHLVSDYHDMKAAVIVTFTNTVFDLVEIFVVFFFYNDPDGPGAILDEFNAIDALVDATHGGWVFGDLLADNSQFSFYGMRYLIRENTMPNLPGAAGDDLYHEAFDSWHDLALGLSDTVADNLVFSMAFQPIPHQLVQSSVDSPNGGNRLGLLPETGDHVFIEYDVSWLSAATDSFAASYIQKVTQPLADYQRANYANTTPTNYQRGNLAFTNFNPTFMNDAMYDQDPVRTYGAEIYNRLAQIQKQVDPSGLFSQRTGGWKYSS